MDIKKVMKNISLTFIFLTLTTLFGYIARIIFARNLPTSDYGLFYAVIDFFAFFAIFRSLGTIESLVHFIPKYLKEKSLKRLKYAVRTVFYLQLFVGFIIAAIFFTFSDQIALQFFHIQEAGLLIKIQAITFFLIGFAEFLAGFYNGMQKPQLAALYDTIRLTVVILASLLLIVIGSFFIQNLMIVWLLSYVAIIIFYAVVFLKRHSTLISVPLEKYGDVIKDLKTYSIPLMLGIAADLILSKSDVLILTFMKGVQDVAFYEVAYPTSRLMLLLIAPFSFVLFPMVSKMYFDKQKEHIKNILQFAYNSGLFMLAPVMALLLIYPEVVLRVLFSEKYVQVARATQIFTAGVFFLVFSQINFSILSGIGEIKEKTKILYFAAIFNVVFDILLIPKFGYIGAIVVTSISYFLMWLLGYRICSREIEHFKLNLKYIAKIFVCLVLFLIIVFYLKSVLVLNMYLEATVVSLVSIVIYFVLGIFVFRIINIATVKQMLNQMRKNGKTA